MQAVIHILLHCHGYAVNTYFQCDYSLRSHPHVTTIGSATGSRHSQQCGIFSRLHRYAENTIDLASPCIVVEVDLIHIHILGATLRQQFEMWVEIHLAGFGNGISPKLVEVGRTFGISLNLLGREGCGTSVAVFLAANVCLDVHTIEARLCHLARKFHLAVLQCGFLCSTHGIHLRTLFILHFNVLDRSVGAQDSDGEVCRFAHLIVPVTVVGSYRHDDIVAPYLGRNTYHLAHHKDCKRNRCSKYSFHTLLYILYCSY